MIETPELVIGDNPGFDPADEPADETDLEYREAWRPDGLGGWVWVAGKRAKAVAEIAEIEAAARVEIERIQAWVQSATAGAVRTKDWAEGLLGSEARARRDEDDTQKSFKLPMVTVTTRVTAPTPEVADPAVFLEWAAVNRPEAVKTSVSPLISKLGETVCTETGVITPDGEQVPGVRVRPGTVTVGFKDA